MKADISCTGNEEGNEKAIRRFFADGFLGGEKREEGRGKREEGRGGARLLLSGAR